MKVIRKHLLPDAGAWVLIVMLLLVQAAGATPQAQPAKPEAPTQTLISYQGMLNDQDGDPVNATVTMTFALYDASSGGNLKWGTETQAVQVADGLFHVLLGSVTPVNPDNLVASDLWLDIKVNNEQLTPRERIASVPHAVQADSLAPGDVQVSGRLILGDANGDPYPGAWIGMVDWLGDSKSWLHIGGIVGNDGVRRAACFATNHYFSGNVGIGVMSPTEQLQVGGNATVSGNLTAGGSLAVYGNGFFGEATYSEGAMNLQSIAVPLTFKESDTSGQGSLWRVPLDETRLRFDSSDNGVDFTSYHTPLWLYKDGSVGCGAITENNLQTAEERAAGRSDRFEQGDVPCWGIDRLEKCATPSDPLVQAVADKSGRPIVIGAEVIKVIGPVKRGDYLVASETPGYAQSTESPVLGTVIAQALEDFGGTQGLIRAMIRKV